MIIRYSAGLKTSHFSKVLKDGNFFRKTYTCFSVGLRAVIVAISGQPHLIFYQIEEMWLDVMPLVSNSFVP